MNKTTQLFCLSYAGGSGGFYNELQNYLDPSIKLFPLEYKGRGRRFSEAAYRDFQEMALDMYDQLLSNLDSSQNFMILGHSMGGFLAYVISGMLENEGYYPSHIFLSGCSSPKYKIIGNLKTKNMTDEQFVSFIKSFGGIDPIVLEKKEYLEFFLPNIRNDFRVIEEMDNSKYIYRLKSPVTLINGNRDYPDESELIDWKDFCDDLRGIEFFEGDHFYMKHNFEAVSNLINSIKFKSIFR